MKDLLRLLLLAALASSAYSQVLPGDLLLNSLGLPDVLVHYQPDGTVLQTSGPGTGTLWEGAAILPNGNWVTTRRMPTNGVNIFDGVTGAEIATWSMPASFSFPGDVGVFSDGTLAIVSQGTGEVWRFDTTGNVIASWKVSDLPFGILVDDQDNVWTTDSSSGVLWHTDDQGNKINEFSTGGAGGDVTMAQDGTLFVARMFGGEVEHYAQDGTFLGAFQATPKGRAYTIAMAHDGTLWVSAELESNIWHYDQVGTLLGSMNVGPATRPCFLTIPVTGEDIGTNYCGPANLNSTGQSAVISAFGSARASGNFVTLIAGQLPLNVFGYFLNSQTKGFVPFAGGSQGNLCLGGAIGRYNRPGEIQNSGAGGTFSLVLDLTDTPQPTGSVSIMAGETWNFQAWFRDNNPGPTSNFTDGVSITFQ